MADRVVLQERQAHGERVTAYSLREGATGNFLGNGTAVGHKRIQLLGAPVAAGATIELSVAAALDTPSILRFAAFGPGACAVPSVFSFASRQHN